MNAFRCQIGANWVSSDEACFGGEVVEIQRDEVMIQGEKVVLAVMTLDTAKVYLASSIYLDTLVASFLLTFVSVA